MTVTFECWLAHFGELRATADVIGTDVFITELVNSTNGRNMMDRPMKGVDRARLHRAALDVALARDDERAAS